MSFVQKKVIYWRYGFVVGTEIISHSFILKCSYQGKQKHTNVTFKT